jgi:hypothetical protein
MVMLIHPAPKQFSAAQIEADPILHFFHYAHLPPALQQTSSIFCGLAVFIVENLPRNAERSVALRKLLEAKDAAVRANVGAKPAETFYDRLKTEHADLVGRLDKLTAFIDGPEFTALVPDLDDRNDLIEQRAHMDNYRQVLEQRLDRLAPMGTDSFSETIDAGNGAVGVIKGPASGVDDPPFE